MAVPNTSAVRSHLDSAKKVSILLPQKPDFDSVAAALGLKLSLDASGKTARVVCAAPMLVEFNRLVGVETIISSFGSRNLIITFPDQTEHVDKVSYNLDHGELQLVITPKTDSPELDHTRLKFISAAGKPDTIILIGISDLRDLGSIYDEVKEYLNSATLISVSHLPHRDQYTLHQLHDYAATGVSEIAAGVIDSLGLSLDADSASNLLAGLEKATDYFRSPKVSVVTFEIAARLMRQGAVRHHDEISAVDFPAGAIPSVPESTAGEVGLEPVETAPDQIPVEQQITPTPVPAKTNGKKSAPADWYEPKIYKGPMQP